MKLAIPSGSEGLQEIISDPKRLKQYFSAEAVANGDTQSFLEAHAREFAKANPDTVTDIRDQVQSVMFDMIRDNAGGSRPRVNIVGGRPAVSFDADSTAAISRGRGTVYNKTAPGAVFEASVRQEDRLNSIGEYCQAIRAAGVPGSMRNSDELLQKLKNVKQFQNSFGSEDPGAGGFLIPEIMRSELLQLALENSIVRSRATVIPMSTLKVPIPMVDDTSHATSVFGGVQFYWEEESAALTESQATFGRVQLEARKLTGAFRVPNELLADAPAFSTWFDTRIPAGYAWFEDVAFLTGDGAEKPQGFISSPAAIQVAAESGQSSGTVVWENIVKMYSRMLPQSLANAVWIASIDVIPQIMTMALSVGTGGSGVMVGNFPGMSGADAMPVTILGRPVIFSEKVPKLGTTGDINFVDLSYYLIGDRQAVSVAASDQYAFLNDQTVYRIISRVDGRPWLQTALTPHNGGPTLSAFVQLASR